MLLLLLHRRVTCPDIVHRSTLDSMNRFIAITVLSLALYATAASACGTGDKACHCKKLGGDWRSAEGILAPTCRVYYNHQGMCSMSDCLRANIGLMTAAVLHARQNSVQQQ